MMRRVLVVEDNSDNMILISDVLNSLGYQVLAAQAIGEEGIQSARSKARPDPDGFAPLPRRVYGRRPAPSRTTPVSPRRRSSR
ncbi:MAG: hypothetical protein U0703_17005 [Anaerolineae bacterium]